MKLSKFGFLSVLVGILLVNVHAAQITWSNSGGNNEFSNPENCVGGSFPASESMVVDLTGANKAVVSMETAPNSDAVLLATTELTVSSSRLEEL